MKCLHLSLSSCEYEGFFVWKKSQLTFKRIMNLWDELIGEKCSRFSPWSRVANVRHQRAAKLASFEAIPQRSGADIQMLLEVFNL